MYGSPVAAALAESAGIALLPSSYLKHSGLLDQMRREILCESGSAVPDTVSQPTQATLELIVNGILPGGNGYDLTDAQSA